MIQAILSILGESAYKVLFVVAVTAGIVYSWSLHTALDNLSAKNQELTARNLQLLRENQALQGEAAAAKEWIDALSEQYTHLLKHKDLAPKRGETNEAVPVDDDFLRDLFDRVRRNNPEPESGGSGNSPGTPEIKPLAPTKSGPPRSSENRGRKRALPAKTGNTDKSSEGEEFHGWAGRWCFSE